MDLCVNELSIKQLVCEYYFILNTSRVIVKFSPISYNLDVAHHCRLTFQITHKLVG